MAESQKSTKSTKSLQAKSVAEKSADHVKGQIGGFFDFIRSQGVIGLAVGLAIGAAAGDTVKKIVEGFINPIVQFITGSGSTLATSTWTFHAFGRSATFAWGAALSSLITLLATALVIYWLVNIFRLDKLDKKKN
ncbi:MAG: MscL family protein [Candidatus Saccharimonadaceae bacterium]